MTRRLPGIRLAREVCQVRGTDFFARRLRLSVSVLLPSGRSAKTEELSG